MKNNNIINIKKHNKEKIRRTKYERQQDAGGGVV